MSLTTRRLGSPSPEPSRPGLLEHCTAIPDHWPHAWAADLVTHVCPGRLPLLERLRRRVHAMVDSRIAEIDARLNIAREKYQAAVERLDGDGADRAMRVLNRILEERLHVPKQRDPQD